MSDVPHTDGTAPVGWSIEVKFISLSSGPVSIRGDAPTGIAVSFMPGLISLADSGMAYQFPSPPVLAVFAIHAGCVVLAGAVSRRFRQGERRRVPTARIVGAFLSMTAVVISHLIGATTGNAVATVIPLISTFVVGIAITAGRQWLVCRTMARWEAGRAGDTIASNEDVVPVG